MSLPKILISVNKQLEDLPALIDQITAAINSVAALGEQQNCIETKLDQVLELLNQPTETKPAEVSEPSRTAKATKDKA